MNYTSLALAFVFAAVAMPFIARSRKESDPAQRRNKRLAGVFFLAAGGAFLVAFAISAVKP